MSKINLRVQQRNANGHTERGMTMLDSSITQDGFIGAVTVAANGEVFDGSARTETIENRFSDVEPIIVRSNGDRPIIHIREDIATAEDPKAVRLSVAANQIAAVNLNWDGEILEEMQYEADLSGLFNDEEWSIALSDLADSESEGLGGHDSENSDDRNVSNDSEDEEDEPISNLPNNLRPLSIVLTWAEYQEWKVIKESLGAKSDKDAFLKLMRE
ncbi:MAG: hypothetical protein SFY66_19720 [Oculatellaceae cyanobacterium bins.114]|nr:hypothetical protein [Oculatellaceae cyanobacterium bins.114]